MIKVLGASEKLDSAEFYQEPPQQRVGNGERSNVVVQAKTRVGSTTPTRSTEKRKIFNKTAVT